MAIISLPRSRRRASTTLDWQVYDNETEYRAAMLHPLPPPAPPAQKARRPLWLLPAVLLAGLIVGVISLQLWRMAQTGLAQARQALSVTVEADLWAAAHAAATSSSNAPGTTGDWQRQIDREAAHLQGLNAATPLTAPLTATTQLLDLGENWALVQVTTQAASDQTTYRQTRVYAETEWGWVRVPPRALYWGSPRQWETAHFSFRYYAHDQAAVRAAAARLEALYPMFYAAFFPEPPAGPKLTVEVTPERMPGRLAEPAQPGAPIITPSPGVYLAPNTVSDADLLAQAVALRLLGDLLAQARERYAASTYWQPVLEGVYLWQLWESNLPLAAWRVPLVKLIYQKNLDMEPAFLPDFCAQHNLWMASPLEIGVPLMCYGRPSIYYLTVWGETAIPPLGAATPPASHAAAGMQNLLRGRESLEDEEWLRQYHPAITIALAVALATAQAPMLDYAAADYGPLTIPALLAALQKHDEWTTLVPAVFGVSAAEFDARWRDYLIEAYGLDRDIPAAAKPGPTPQTQPATPSNLRTDE